MYCDMGVGELGKAVLRYSHCACDTAKLGARRSATIRPLARGGRAATWHNMARRDERHDAHGTERRGTHELAGIRPA